MHTFIVIFLFFIWENHFIFEAGAWKKYLLALQPCLSSLRVSNMQLFFVMYVNYAPLFFFPFVIPFFIVLYHPANPHRVLAHFFGKMCGCLYCIVFSFPLILCIGVYRASQFLIRFFYNFPLGGFSYSSMA